MSTTIIRARSLPYREPRPGTYTCQRCGIERNIDYRRTNATNTHCRDCRPYITEEQEAA